MLNVLTSLAETPAPETPAPATPAPATPAPTPGLPDLPPIVGKCNLHDHIYMQYLEYRTDYVIIDFMI